MPSSRNQEPTPALRDALELRTIDDLKKLVALLPTKERPLRKGELVELIERHLTGDGLRALWEQLDDFQQKAVSELTHSPDGYFRADRFKARYGALPMFEQKKDAWDYHGQPTLLRLFIYRSGRYNNHSSVLPADLRQRLLGFVPAPAAPALRAIDELPEFYELTEKEYEFSDDDSNKSLTVFSGNKVYEMRRPHSVKEIVHQIPIVRRDTERAAPQELQTVLRLIDKGKVTVSDKTFQASSATEAEIAALLRDGDFYELTPKKNKWEQEVGAIRAFAWPLLVQAAKLAELSSKKLTLTKAGRGALAALPAETLKLIWQRWLKAKLLDEFNRVEIVKGQHGKGKRGMTATEGRRAVINETLKQCPVGRWVKFDDFSRHMKATGQEFEVTREPWELYIEDSNYGNLGYDGYHDWHIVQGRYIRCLLFEYAATLGLVDLAYIPPQKARRDFGEMWGTDDLAFLSRYDGLTYFRLNPLGAYCLGLAGRYTPSQIEARAALTVLPSLRINVSETALSADEKLLLETWAEKESDEVWHLSHEKSLAAVESGNDIAELREFLQSRDEQPLPHTVESFIVTTAKRARALQNKGTALLIECADADIATQLAVSEQTKKLCRRAGEKHLVVLIEAEESFRKALHGLGYGMPRV